MHPMPEMPQMPGVQPNVAPPPPPPPGFEPQLKIEEISEKVSTWEDLPPGGAYIESDPLQYTGEGIGTWVERDDESWERILD